jgi:lipopolysaccharide transport system ATP-binding protein
VGDIAIRVEGLGKRYRIGASQAPYRTLRETIVDAARAPFRRLAAVARGEASRSAQDTIWALKDVSFEVKQGEVLGIIGRNGAGKSTLLKILSRITKPTEGHVELLGRVGSLLEVGTGFHPELTGRENIYLNGAILGMRRSEIARKFDEIVAFAEIEKFLDTPVKHYSSGMYVRLAFAVAAHLEPEILLVDEVLAVGDAAFQKKCLGKMGDVAQRGRTVLFVSHNMGAIHRLCPESMWIDLGTLRRFGPASEIIRTYLGDSGKAMSSGEVDLSDWPHRYGSGEARILSARTLDENEHTTTTFHRSSPLTAEFVFECHHSSSLHFSMVVMSDSGEKVLHLSHLDTPGLVVDPLMGRHRARFTMPKLPLCSGNYSLVLAIHTQSLTPVDVVTDVLPFTAEDMINSPRPYETITEYAYCWTPNHFSITSVA